MNVLTQPIIRFDPLEGPRVSASLPEVYAALMLDRVGSFPALRPHQRHAWHAFLVQLGTIAMQRSGWSGSPPTEAETWRSLIRGMTPEYPHDEPWNLVVDDLTKPALLQPPATTAELSTQYKHKIATADDLDMLVTAKNHDVKCAVAAYAANDDWLFALITLQTMDGNPGRNPGISRMNGAYGNRPAFSLAPVGGPGSHVRRDISVSLTRRPEILSEWPMSDLGASLLWTISWDGRPEAKLLLMDLDPFYLEVCRRIRLDVSIDGKLSARRATSQATRIEAKAMNGKTGDPWTPINQKEDKSLTIAAGGFTHRYVTEYLTSPD